MKDEHNLALASVAKVAAGTIREFWGTWRDHSFGVRILHIWKLHVNIVDFIPDI